MKGKIESMSEALADDQPGVENSVSYTAEIEKPVAEAPPTAADAAAARNRPAARAYLDRLDAVQKGDKARLLESLVPVDRAQLEASDFKQMLPLLQALQPKNLKVLKAVEKDGVATLWLSGMMEGKPQKGDVEMKLESGHWFVRLEIWH